MSDPDSRPDPRRRRTAVVVVAAAAAVVALLVVASLMRGGAHTPSADPAPVAPSAAPAASAAASTAPTPSPTRSVIDPGDPSTQSSGEHGIGVELARRDQGDPLAIGRVDAPVVLVEWADFRCPFCGEFARDTKPKLMPYVENGTLRIEFRNYPIFGEQSIVAAHAAYAAGLQGRFWQFYDAVYADAPPRGHADLPTKKLIAYAKAAGVPDLAKFQADLTNREITAKVSDDMNEALAIGISSTPTFVVNQIPIVGAQPSTVFVQEIERQAQQAENGG